MAIYITKADSTLTTEEVFNELLELGCINLNSNEGVTDEDLQISLGLGPATSIDTLASKSVRRRCFYIGQTGYGEEERIIKPEIGPQIMYIKLSSRANETAKRIHSQILEREHFLESESQSLFKESE